MLDKNGKFTGFFEKGLKFGFGRLELDRENETIVTFYKNGLADKCSILIKGLEGRRRGGGGREEDGEGEEERRKGGGKEKGEEEEGGGKEKNEMYFMVKLDRYNQHIFRMD